MAQNWRQYYLQSIGSESTMHAAGRGRVGPATVVLPRFVGMGCLLCLSACAVVPSVDQSIGHVQDEARQLSALEPVVNEPAPPPVPEPVPPLETYTVVVKDVPVKDLLFSLATDAGLELDLQVGSDRTITINAVAQSLPNILKRIAAQSQLRFDLTGNNLVVQDDQPYWHNYMVDYVNVSRSAIGEVGVATQIATSGGSVAEDSTGSQQDGNGNTSKTTVTSQSSNDFWANVEQSLASIIQSIGNSEPDVASPDTFNPVIINRMAGIVTVLASQEGHREAQRYLDKVTTNAQRQVLIEMTIVEVELSDRYQAGVDWQRLSDNSGLGSNGVSLEQDMLGANLSASPFVSLGFNSFDADGSGVSGAVRALQQFGDTKVLSSPKIMALNNQTALLKVVNEEVFFTVELDVRDATADIPARRTFTSEIHTVPVGLVLSVTPQISEEGYVSLNIRPTISRITGFSVDPGPRLADAEFDNLIPEIQVREIESLLQVQNGRTIVLGGLMQNEIVNQTDGIPGLSRIPKIGSLFSYTNDQLIKTELVIFLRPSVIKNGTSPPNTRGASEYYGELGPTSRGSFTTAPEGPSTD